MFKEYATSKGEKNTLNVKVVFLKKYFLYLLVLATFLLLIFNFLGCDFQREVKRFELLDASRTHINFNNKLTATDSLNILNFEYMFNGGGVAIGDMNNDGWQDIYFTGNQVSNRLYLNQGNFTFKDVTESAAVGSAGWSNGAAMVDINEDGFMDIYVCKGGPRNASVKETFNLFFINNGDGTFKESAKELGLNDSGYSIQALFFDYDRDGDKDLYLLTNALVEYNRNTSKVKEINGEAKSTDRLYRNDGSKGFTDVSHEAGILIEGFGLGVSLCDINQDGWQDIYVSNDFLTNDLLYVNNQDGTFTNQIDKYLKHQSYNGMGNDIADIDNDGNMDIMVVDMFPNNNKRIKQSMMKTSHDTYAMNTGLGYSPQFVRNTLQLNNGNGTFSEIGQLTGIHNTDWSWAPLLADFDNDGKKDVFITNGYRRDITNLDYIVYSEQASYFGGPKSRDSVDLKRLQTLPEVKLHNYIFKNEGNLQFSQVVDQWGLAQPNYSNGAVYVDLDNDGDLELVINNIDDKASIYKNNTMEMASEAQTPANYLAVELVGKQKNGAMITVYLGDETQVQMFSPVRGYLSTVSDRMHFGLCEKNLVDSLTIKWADGKSQSIKKIESNQVVTLNYKDAVEAAHEKRVQYPVVFKEISDSLNLKYHHEEDDFLELRYQTSLLKMNTELGPGIAVGDVNGDGLEDFYVGGSKRKNGELFVQNMNGTFNGRSLGTESREDMAVVLVDYDADGDLDLISIDGGGVEEMNKKNYTDLIYVNDGAGNFTEEILLKREGRGSCAELADIDKDGDLDIFIGGRVINGSYPNSPQSNFLANEQGNFVDKTFEVFSDDTDFGMVSDAIFTDFNNDDWLDLIVVGEFMEVRFFLNTKGKLSEITASTGLKNMSGWWNSIVSSDFDQDGDTDYIVGNLGQNSDVKASESEPVTLYAKDFDKNGSVDPLMSCFRNGEEHLIHPRDVLIGQISAMRNRFVDYESYANASMENILWTKDLKEALILKADNFQSTYIENLGNSKFKSASLPIQAQFAPVYGMQVNDYNHDGFLDVFLAGNHYDVEPFMGPYDASIGTLFYGDGMGGFTYVSASESGLKNNGDAKGMATLLTKEGSVLTLIGQNSNKLLAYESKIIGQILPAQPFEVSAWVYLRNGKKIKYEFTYGNAYLSQSSRFIVVDPQKTLKVEFKTAKGEIRKTEW